MDAPAEEGAPATVEEYLNERRVKRRAKTELLSPPTNWPKKQEQVSDLTSAEIHLCSNCEINLKPTRNSFRGTHRASPRNLG
jgi:hypothetical protein